MHAVMDPTVGSAYLATAKQCKVRTMTTVTNASLFYPTIRLHLILGPHHACCAREKDRKGSQKGDRAGSNRSTADTLGRLRVLHGGLQECLRIVRPAVVETCKRLADRTGRRDLHGFMFHYPNGTATSTIALTSSTPAVDAAESSPTFGGASTAKSVIVGALVGELVGEPVGPLVGVAEKKSPVGATVQTERT